MKILLVDDDGFFRALTLSALSKAGHQVAIAHDGREAVEKVQYDEFDLIVTDIFMPNKEGIEVIHDIKQLRPGIKIIAISSDSLAGHTTFLEIARACGADATLQKPFNPAELIGKIDELAARPANRRGDKT